MLGAIAALLLPGIRSMSRGFFLLSMSAWLGFLYTGLCALHE
ncbi:hypothetical protein ACP0HM_06750 [Escherichia coli]